MKRSNPPMTWYLHMLPVAMGRMLGLNVIVVFKACVILLTLGCALGGVLSLQHVISRTPAVRWGQGILVAALFAALVALRDELGLPGEPELAMLTRFGDVFRSPERDRTVDVEPAILIELTEAAAAACKDMREAEGLRLFDDLSARLVAIGAQLDLVEKLGVQNYLQSAK